MNLLDTRTLLEERDNLKEQILDAYNEEFETDYSDFEDINVALLGDDLGEVDYTEEEIETLNNFKDIWKDELKQIEEINEVEDEVGSEFEFGTTLIDEDDFEDYCEELVEDIGDLPNKIKQNKYKSKPIEKFTLNKGHELSLINKIGYLKKHYEALTAEAIKRGFNPTDYSNAFEGIPTHLMNDYTPSEHDIQIVRERITERLKTMKNLKYYREPITLDEAIKN